MSFRTKAHQSLYSVAAETLPIEIGRDWLIDETGHQDLIAHVLLCAGWTRKELGVQQIAPTWLWTEDTGQPTEIAINRLGFARDGVLTIEELFKLSDTGTWSQMYTTLRRLATMPLDAEFRVRVTRQEAEDDDD